MNDTTRGNQHGPSGTSPDSTQGGDSRRGWSPGDLPPHTGQGPIPGQPGGPRTGPGNGQGNGPGQGQGNGHGNGHGNGNGNGNGNGEWQ